MDIHLSNTKEMNVTQNDDGTFEVEFIGCKIIEDGEEREVRLVFPKVPECELKSVICN